MEVSEDDEEEDALHQHGGDRPFLNGNWSDEEADSVVGTTVRPKTRSKIKAYNKVQLNAFIQKRLSWVDQQIISETTKVQLLKQMKKYSRKMIKKWEHRMVQLQKIRCRGCDTIIYALRILERTFNCTNTLLMDSKVDKQRLVLRQLERDVDNVAKEKEEEEEEEEDEEGGEFNDARRNMNSGMNDDQLADEYRRQKAEKHKKRAQNAPSTPLDGSAP